MSVRHVAACCRSRNILLWGTLAVANQKLTQTHKSKKFTLHNGNISKTEILYNIRYHYTHFWPQALDAYKLVLIVKCKISFRFFGDSIFACSFGLSLLGVCINTMHTSL